MKFDNKKALDDWDQEYEQTFKKKQSETVKLSDSEHAYRVGLETMLDWLTEEIDNPHYKPETPIPYAFAIATFAKDLQQPKKIQRINLYLSSEK